MGDAQAGQCAVDQRFGIVGAHAHARRPMQLHLAIPFEAPGEGRGQAGPVETVMFDQLRRIFRHAAALQVVGAGAGDTHHARQRRGHQPRIGQLPGAQHQVDLAQVQALHVDKTVDQLQLHVEAGIKQQEIGNHRCEMSPPERSRCVNTNQAFRSTAQGHRFGPGQAQFGDYPPCPFGKRQPRRRRAHRVGTANEQLAADGAFQAVDAPRHCRGRQGMTAGRCGKAAGFQHIQKQTQLFGQLIGIHVWLDACASLA
ncbi:hypothetical protein D3C73_1072460 [compost metagenome]